MKINEKYEVRVIVGAEINNKNGYQEIGDIYDDYQEFVKDHPNSKAIFGYCVVDTVSNTIPKSLSDWHDNVADALIEFYERYGFC